MQKISSVSLAQLLAEEQEIYQKGLFYQILPGERTGENMFRQRLNYQQFWALYQAIKDWKTADDEDGQTESSSLWIKQFHCCYYYYYRQNQILLCDQSGRSKVYRRRVKTSKYFRFEDRDYHLKVWEKEIVPLDQTDMGAQLGYHLIEKIHKYVFLGPDFKISFEVGLMPSDETTKEDLLEKAPIPVQAAARVYQLRIDLLNRDFVMDDRLREINSLLKLS